jgi:type I restriction enzyme M protein
MRRLREEYWSALFGLGHRLAVGALPEGEARRLVTVPVEGRLHYQPDAAGRVVGLCARQPFLLQSLGNRIFEAAASSGERTVTCAAVDAAAAEMVQDNEHFRTMWDYAGTYRRRLLLDLCERLATGPDAVTLDVLAANLEALGLTFERRSVLADDVEFLRELELLEFDATDRGGTYRVAVPLFGLWLRTAIDLDDAATRAREEAQGALT